MISSAVSFGNRLEQLAVLAASHRVPASYKFREFASARGPMSSGINRTAPIVRLVPIAAVQGEKPADLPVVQPTKFEFVINLKTAKALGLSIPDNLLALAD